MNIIAYEKLEEQKRHGTAHFAYNTYPCAIFENTQRVAAHWHDEMEIIFVKSGFGVVQVDLDSYKVKQNSVVFVAPGRLHAIDADNKTQMEYDTSIFALSILDAKDDWCRDKIFEPLRNGTFNLPVILNEGDKGHSQIAECLNKAGQICACQNSGYPLLVKAQLLELFYILYNNRQSVKDKEPVLLCSDRTKQALQYVEQNYSQPISIEQIASQLCCSPSHFMRFFKKAVGVPFVYYLNNYRLAMAARMLEETKVAVITIAQMCGFENLSYFNRCFKKVYKCTPTQYRQKC